VKEAAGAMSEWPSPTPGHPMSSSATKPRAAESEWLWFALARDPFHTPPPCTEANARPGPQA